MYKVCVYVISDKPLKKPTSYQAEKKADRKHLKKTSFSPSRKKSEKMKQKAQKDIQISIKNKKTIIKDKTLKVTKERALKNKPVYKTDKSIKVKTSRNKGKIELGNTQHKSVTTVNKPKLLVHNKLSNILPKQMDSKYTVLMKRRRYDIADLGESNMFRGWVDVQGQGAANDYCRWVYLICMSLDKTATDY